MKRRPAPIEAIQASACRRDGISLSELVSAGAVGRYGRLAVMCVANEHGHSHTAVAEAVRRKPSTVAYGLSRMRQRLIADRFLLRLVIGVRWDARRFSGQWAADADSPFPVALAELESVLSATDPALVRTIAILLCHGTPADLQLMVSDQLDFVSLEARDGHDGGRAAELTWMRDRLRSAATARLLANVTSSREMAG